MPTQNGPTEADYLCSTCGQMHPLHLSHDEATRQRPTDPNVAEGPPPPRFARVQIVNRQHPHFEEYGRFTGKLIRIFGEDMAEVSLEHCRHGVDGCFVKPGDVRVVEEQ